MNDSRQRQEEKDLRELTSLLLSTTSKSTSSTGNTGSQQHRHPAVILVSATGGETAATALAAALGVIPTSGSDSTLVRLADESVSGRSLREEESLVKLERSHGRLIALVPPSERVLIRAAAIAASRAVILTGHASAELRLTGTIVGELLAGAPALPVAVIASSKTPISLPPAAVQAGRTGWTWAPGQTLPSPLERFVAEAVPGPVSLSWALTNLSVFRDDSRVVPQRLVSNLGQ